MAHRQIVDNIGYDNRDPRFAAGAGLGAGLARVRRVAAGLGVAVIPSLLLSVLPPGVRALRVEDPKPFRREVLAVTRPDRSQPIQTVIVTLREEAARLAR